jgi:hypothetical protein
MSAHSEQYTTLAYRFHAAAATISITTTVTGTTATTAAAPCKHTDSYDASQHAYAAQADWTRITVVQKHYNSTVCLCMQHTVTLVLQPQLLVLL